MVGLRPIDDFGLADEEISELVVDEALEYTILG
jgi:hypothetical protein